MDSVIVSILKFESFCVALGQELLDLCNGYYRNKSDINLFLQIVLLAKVLHKPLSRKASPNDKEIEVRAVHLELLHRLLRNASEGVKQSASWGYLIRRLIVTGLLGSVYHRASYTIFKNVIDIIGTLIKYYQVFGKNFYFQ